MPTPTLLLIRPAARIPADAALCRRAGWQPVPFPLIRIAAEPTALAGLPAQMQQAAAVVWISPSAVETALSACSGSLSHLTQPQIAVGGGTAQALRQAGFANIISPPGGHDSEAVLALPWWHTLGKGSCILIIRGAHGRHLLPDALCQRGFQVACADIYQRLPIEPDWAVFHTAQPAAAWITSAEQVRLLFAAVPASLAQRLQSLLYFAHHPRIAQALSQAGAARIRLLDSAAELESALIAERQNPPQAT
ncbi:uroporphyrinogen-III synthase [Eikenella sp. S3360]|uniref:Uroporphyrinogen-III synthase n=1 Tax=Eikenella glucosivorans TaxID=2766967 RepID=A0ABS0NCX9_9NEIS|nr:uroporphyrinogen-III synthase [Eikenella glucosivorans]MBH5330115.1 uroporphyrinogen-III synthase [Eikenella glucosivorans]